MQDKDLTEMDEKLEGYLDTFGLSVVLASLENICHEKSEHVRANYPGDDWTQNRWTELGKDLDKYLEKHKDTLETLGQ